MKRIIIASVLLASLFPIEGQERLSREEALKYAFYVSADLKELLKTPIPTDPDVKRPVALRDGDRGGMVLPEAKLSPDTFSHAGKNTSAVGQLWLVKLAPTSEGRAVPAARLRIVRVSAGEQEGEAACCALGVSKNADRGLELLIYGKDKEAVARAPMKSISEQQESPIEMSFARKEDKSMVTMKFLGKFEATFPLSDVEEY